QAQAPAILPQRTWRELSGSSSSTGTFKRHAGEQEEDADLWIGYCAFHLGDYKRALEEYENLTKRTGCSPDVWVNLACTYFFLGMYTQAEQAALKAPKSRLQNRLLFHLAHKFLKGLSYEKELYFCRYSIVESIGLGCSSGQAWKQKAWMLIGKKAHEEREIRDWGPIDKKAEVSEKMFGDEKKLMSFHQNLQDITEDQLSLASIHYMRSHYQEAIDIYKRILLDNREYLALNVYVALCYYKLDYYDVSQEVLAVYLQQVPDSTIALNLKACNHFRLYNGKAAEGELKSLMDSASTSFEFAKELIKHNLVVFRGGEGALQVFPPLVDVIPEARLNLVIYYLRQDDVQEAYNLIKDLEPTTPQEYILKGVVHAVLGQEIVSREHLKIAQQFFQLVGGSASECDTIPGRQCMASCFFLLRQFDDVLIYLNSVKSYFYNDDTFNFNYAQAKAATGNTSEAEEVFLLIQSEKIKNDFVYLSWLTRCCESPYSVIKYKFMGQFYYSAKAFDVLERLDPNPEYWEGKRGACVGIFQMVVAGREPKDTLREVLHLLRSTGNPQVEYIVRIIKKWAKENRVPI
ncbi:hypothetical protein JD844_028236, partial [Phrynosoma platyrhinos]